ncbi:hypothetical protein [Phenylobacterium sp.]|nr:hypothetical protein [Phenylobacterium sp.]
MQFGRDLAGRRVLVVEDDPMVLELIARVGRLVHRSARAGAAITAP